MAEPILSPERMTYAIRLKGYLDRRWAHRFDGFEIHYQPDGTTLLLGEILDQPALHGILRQIGDIGIPLLSVICQENREGIYPQEVSHD